MLLYIIVAFAIPLTTDVLIQFRLYLQHITTYCYNNALSIKYNQCTLDNGHRITIYLNKLDDSWHAFRVTKPSA